MDGQPLAQPPSEWVAIIAAIFVGMGTLVTACTAAAVLVLQVMNKRDTDAKLEVIHMSVNGNLTLVNEQLSMALEALQLKLPPRPTAAELTAMHRKQHHRET